MNELEILKESIIKSYRYNISLYDELVENIKREKENKVLTEKCIQEDMLHAAEVYGKIKLLERILEVGFGISIDICKTM